jgi:hypothetical protein
MFWDVIVLGAKFADVMVPMAILSPEMVPSAIFIFVTALSAIWAFVMALFAIFSVVTAPFAIFCVYTRPPLTMLNATLNHVSVNVLLLLFSPVWTTRQTKMSPVDTEILVADASS